MTALNFMLMEEAVYVVADTMVTEQSDPLFFTTKVFPVPHWNGLICGRGSLGLMIDWLGRVYGHMLARDFIEADQFAPDTLRQLFLDRPIQEQAECTTSIYHLAYHPDEQRFIGFAYRSTDDFVSEPLDYGFHQKPGISIKMKMESFPDDFAAFMQQQRLEQDLLPSDDRCFIGGQIISWMMRRINPTDAPSHIETVIAPAFQWDDYEESYQACCDRLHG